MHIIIMTLYKANNTGEKEAEKKYFIAIQGSPCISTTVTGLNAILYNYSYFLVTMIVTIILDSISIYTNKNTWFCHFLLVP